MNNDNLIGNELVTCRVCGAFNTQLSTHCVKCGNTLKEETKEEVEVKKKRNIIPILLIIVLLILLIGFGVWYFIIR